MGANPMTHKPSLRNLEEAVLDAAIKVSLSQQASGSTLAPGERGVGGQQVTGWIRAEPFEELLEAGYALARHRQRLAEGLETE